LDIVDYIDFQDYIDPNHLFENMEPQAAVKSDFFCPYPWQMVPIMGNGDIRVCCSWYGENLLLGNVKEMSIKKAWDLPFMNEIRKMVATRVYEKDCARCVNARENVKFFSQEQSSEI
jgi:radical SAM protein with 4Fe4S-binding SPASM domain